MGDKEQGKDRFAKNVWDEFDEFFAFHSDSGPSSRDDTKGADYKADIDIEFLDAALGVHKVVLLLVTPKADLRDEQEGHLSLLQGHQGQDGEPAS